MNSASSPTPLRLRLAPAIISGLLIAAHFLHAGSRPLALLGIAFPLLLLAKRPWAVRIVHVLLLLCAVEWLRTVSPKEDREPWVSIMVVHVSCDFRMAMEYPGTVEVRVHAGAVGRTSVTLHHEMRLLGDERIRAEGQDKVVLVDTRINKATPLPPAIAEIFVANSGEK